jgi:exopolyphosphatase
LPDLDSIASSIGYAFFAAATSDQPATSADKPTPLKFVPLVQTARGDLTLRPENIEAFKKSSLSADNADLLCIDDITSITPFPSDKFVLVDHNRLGETFHAPDSSEQVVALFDHHVDERLYPNANPRIINAKAGSCSSLIVNNFVSAKNWNADIAKLLLSAGCIDTGGLKPDGKAIEVDVKAADFTLPIATNDPTRQVGDNISKDPFIKSLTKDLKDKKDDVGSFSNRDLLRRDYKQYSFTSSKANSGKPAIVVGLSTVPVDLKEWVKREPSALAAYMDERKLTILGALTSFDRESALPNMLGKKKKVHKRQSLWMIHPDAPADLDAVLWSGLLGSKELDLEELKKWKKKMGFKKSEKLRGQAYKQKNVEATRKTVAPLVEQIVQGYLDAEKPSVEPIGVEPVAVAEPTQEEVKQT